MGRKILTIVLVFMQNARTMKSVYLPYTNFLTKPREWLWKVETFLSRLAHGFWARANPVSASWDSLKPPNNFLWKVSFCQVLTLSPSSDTRERQMEACKEARRSAEDRKHCQDFRREPYIGPEESHVFFFILEMILITTHYLPMRNNYIS